MSAAAAAAEVPAAKKPGGKKKLLIIVAAAVLLLGGGVGTMLVMKKQKAAAEAAAAAEDDDGAPVAHAPKKDKNAHPVFVPMDPFVVNLADHEADRYAQIGITLEVPDEHVGEEIKTFLPAIRNNILLLLAHKSSADLAGGEGKELLAHQIKREALKAMGEEVDEDDEVEAGAASAPPSKSKKKKKHAAEADSPIRSVQFSSFIIQ